ncbi:MAG: single-stranded DNA-binding protein [Candidatus Peregrinibacteria bacterium]|nr:single-stranded DNA-binding protein [Candidatus Peregrinibacteria bacterium]
MFSFNRVHIIGYQTQPVTVRQTPGGTSVTDLNLVTPYSFRSASGEQLTGKNFHVVTLWGPMAEVAGKFIRPGSQIFISGRLQTDSWEDEKTGDKRSKTKIVALDMILLDPKDGQLPALQGGQSVSTLVNRADIIGHVTRDPEIRTTTSGQQVLTLGVATNERWKDKASGEDRERTEFHNVVIWGELATDVSTYIKKGNRVFVSGRVQTRSWEAKDGSKRYTTEVIAESISLLGVRSPVADEVIQTDSQRVQSAPVAAATEGVSVPGDTVPELTYASEIKVEDLPF